MVKEKGTPGADSLEKIYKSFPDKERIYIERLSIVTMFCLITGILLITFEMRLLAGSIILVGSSLGIMLVRKALRLIKQVKESLREASSSK